MNTGGDSPEFVSALATLLSGHSDECILDAILKRIPERDLCLAMLRVFERQNTIVASSFPEGTIMCAIGLGSTLVQGCSSVNINVQTGDHGFRLDRLIISSSVAADFLVTDIKANKVTQLNSRGAFPGTAFTENVFAVKLKGDVIPADRFITVSATNQNANDRNFQGVLIGHIDRPPSVRLNPHGD